MVGRIALWNSAIVDRWMLQAEPDKPEQVTDDVLAKRAKGIRKSMRRLHLVPKVSGDGRE